MEFQPGRTVPDVFKHYEANLGNPKRDQVPDGLDPLPEHQGDGKDFERVAAWYTKNLDQNIAPDAPIPILPGFQERMIEAAQAGIRIAVITSADFVTFSRAKDAAIQTPEARAKYPWLPERGLQLPPDTIYITGDRLEGGPGKPNPHAIHLAMSKAGIDDPSKVQMWGDSWSDVLAGVTAGTETLALATGSAATLKAWDLTPEGVRRTAEKKGVGELVPDDFPAIGYVNSLEEVAIVRSPEGVAEVARGVQPRETAEMDLSR